MRVRTSLLMLLLGCPAFGQATTSNLFEIFPGSTDATSRSGLAGGALGDVLIEVRGRSYFPFRDAFGSVGDLNSSSPTRGGTGFGTVAGFTASLQDQNGSTSESFDFCIVVEGTVAGLPAAPVGGPVGPGVFLRSARLTTPAVADRTVRWVVTTALATPAAVIPTKSTWYYGVGLSSNAAWSNDGLSVSMASFDGLGLPFPNAGDNPYDDTIGIRPNTITYVRDVTNGAVSRSASARTHDVGLLTPAPVLHWGADITSAAILDGGLAPNPCFGVAGIHPVVCGIGNLGRMASYPGYPGRGGVGDGLALRLRAVQAIGSGGFYLISASLNSAAPPAYLNNPGFAGSVCVDLSAVIPVAIGAATGGAIVPIDEFVEPMIPRGPAACSFAGGGAFVAQALLTTPAGNFFTNAAVTHF